MDRCVMCGAEVPEGRMTCKACEWPKGATNRDKLNAMSNMQLGEWIARTVLGLSGERKQLAAKAWARYFEREAGF